jgi:DNA topoisomerase-1
MKNLLIVESPAKAKTIEKYLGGDFKVVASFGHIRDLVKGDGAVQVERNFEPIYEVPHDKLDVVRNLKKLAKEAQEVWLATDEDREGEAISWHLTEVLGLNPRTTKRIAFHEITKSAIQQAVQNPRTLDLNLVNAQQARRVLDRLVGFELSPVLWRKVKAGLSAGRVQSVAVRLVVEREREIQHFRATPFFNVAGQFVGDERKPFKAVLPKRLTDRGAAQAYLEACNGARFTVSALEKKPAKRNPAAPFTTSTLQQEASLKLGLPVAVTMRLAQGLYEAGHITYMRTDSVNLSGQAIAAAKEMIVADFGERYHQVRQYKNKNSSAQEAHEAIRPTDFRARVAGADDREQKLYELIWRRTVASQMASAELERTVVDIDVRPAAGGSELPLQATGEVIVFDGFLKLYLESRNDDSAEDDDDDSASTLLPLLRVGESLTLNELIATERFTRPNARYNEASLVKKLEELGIGRPSTYAPTISTIQKREYVLRESRDGVKREFDVLTLRDSRIVHKRASEVTGAEKSKLFPTDLGLLVTDFLNQYFQSIMDYQFTAQVEGEFDRIATGELEWVQMIDEFYGPFKQTVTQTAQVAERVAGERHIGTDPTTGKPIMARLGRYGPLVQIGDADDETKRFASLKKGQSIETISLEEALKLFELPRLVGEFEGLPIEANVGRFGPYVKHGKLFASLPKGGDPHKVTAEEAVSLILGKRESDANRLIKEFPGTEFRILRGRWGAYVAAGRENLKIPKELKDTPETITLEQCQQWFTEQVKPAKGKKATATTDTPARKPATRKPKAAQRATAANNTAAKARKATAKKSPSKATSKKT